MLSFEMNKELQTKPRLLLHVCCGVCSAYIPETLTPDYDVTMYYENSNIFPAEEFRRRSDAAKTIAEKYGAIFIEVPQDQHAWNIAVAGHAQDPENGERCKLCMGFRLDRAFKYAKEQGFDIVACTLGVSRRKNIDMVNEIGRILSEQYGIPFMNRDWKKGGGEVESQKRAKDLGIYRQNYCGCVYSKTGT
jgi:predicted adenine nucleotide alpha hydrolase (AANH) superfamily ATPase